MNTVYIGDDGFSDRAGLYNTEKEVSEYAKKVNVLDNEISHFISSSALRSFAIKKHRRDRNVPEFDGILSEPFLTTKTNCYCAEDGELLPSSLFH